MTNQHASIAPLKNLIADSLQQFFGQLDGATPADLYELVLAQIEPPLLQSVMKFTEGNQSKAAIILGVSRSTLRKKLQQYQLD